jgi:hypothetical protein
MKNTYDIKLWKHHNEIIKIDKVHIFVDIIHKNYFPDAFKTRI